MAVATEKSSKLLSPLPLLKSPADYNPYTFDIYTTRADLPQFKDWIEVFRKSIPGFVRQALTDETVPEELRQAKAEEFRVSYNAILDSLLESQVAGPRTDCKALCDLREECLRQAGFGDIFKAVKTCENEVALKLLPSVLAELDAQLDDTARMELALRGIFAGNVFDLGAAATVAQYESGEMSFRSTREGLLPRPWVVNDLDAAVGGLTGRRYRKALLFVDNAGSDVVLGMLPFARELVKRGTEVVIAANASPSINDITAEEMVPLLRAAAELDPLGVMGRAVEEGVLRCVSSGSDAPVIDLGQLGPVVNAESLSCDLVVLEGMGRAIETNLRADFKVDAMKVGMVKHPEVAQCLGGRMYDCVCKWDAAPQE